VVAILLLLVSNIFMTLALLVLNERPRWNHGAAFLLIGVAAVLALRK
jgi:uncharacterized protein (DUF486 family)